MSLPNPKTGLITAAVLTAANTPDADSIKDLVADQSPGAEIVADSAYASGAALETFDDLGHTPVVKPIVRKPHIEDGFHRDDFDIDTGRRTVTCPAGHTVRIRPGGTAPFAKRCRGCPLRARCTTSKRGRTITVDQHHDRRAANKARWAKDETQNTYRNLRPSVERTIAWLTHGKARLEFPPLAGHFHSERVLSPTMGLRAGKESCWEGNDRGESSRMSSNETR